MFLRMYDARGPTKMHVNDITEFYEGNILPAIK